MLLRLLRLLNKKVSQFMLFCCGLVFCLFVVVLLLLLLLLLLCVCVDVVVVVFKFFLLEKSV